MFDEINGTTVAENVRRYCDDHGISVAEFERSCGIGNGLVAKWERGRRYVPSIKTLMKMQTRTGIPISTWLRKGVIHAGKKKAAGSGKD